MKRKGRQFFVSDFASADGQNKTRKNAFGSAEFHGNADSSDACTRVTIAVHVIKFVRLIVLLLFLRLTS